MKLKSKILYMFSMAILVMLPPLFSACSSDEPGIEPEPENTNRTVLVYMVASNSLGRGGYDTDDLAEMVTAAQNGDLGKGRLLVYHAPYVSTASRCIPVLKEVTAEGFDTLKIYDAGIESATISQMRQVISDVKELSPSEDYGMILWGHATGWWQDGIGDDDDTLSRSVKAFSYGCDNNEWMNTTSMRVALADQELSFLYFDCCNMANIEVAYELRNVTPVIAASITEVPAWGMPYDVSLKHFFTSGEADILGAAKATYETNMSVYVENGGGDNSCPVSMTVVYTDALDALAEATRKIYSQATSTWPSGYAPIRLGRYYSTTMYNSFFDLADYIKALCEDEQLLADWQASFDDAVPYSSTSPMQWGYVDISQNCGLSTYIIKSSSSIDATYNYNELQWYDDVVTYLPL